MASAGRAEARRVVSDALSGLASLCRSAGQFIEAEQLAGRALADSEASWGSDSLAVVGPLIELGQVFARQDKPQQARAYFERAIATLERRWGPADATLAIPLELFGRLERAQGNYELAETMTRRAIALVEAHDGPEDRQLVPLLALLGALASDRENHNDATQVLERGLTVAEKAFGRNRPQTTQFIAQLAYERDMSDDVEGAERLHRDEISALQIGPHPYHAELAEAFQRYSDFLERHGRSDEAVEAKRQSIELLVKHAREHPADSI